MSNIVIVEKILQKTSWGWLTHLCSNKTTATQQPPTRPKMGLYRDLHIQEAIFTTRITAFIPTQSFSYHWPTGKKGGQPINHTSIGYRPINNIFTNLSVLNLCWPFYWPNGIFMSPVPRFPWNKGDLPRNQKSYKIWPDFVLFEIPGWVCSRVPGDPGPPVESWSWFASTNSIRWTPSRQRYAPPKRSKTTPMAPESHGLRGWLVYIYLTSKTIKKHPNMHVGYDTYYQSYGMVLGNGNWWKLDPLNGRCTVYHIYI